MKRKTTYGFAGMLAAGALLAAGLNVATVAEASELGDVGKSFAKALVTDAKACGKQIKGLKIQYFKSALNCLVTALKKAAKNALVQGARALFNMGVAAIGNNLPKAKELLGKLVNMLPRGMLQNAGNAALAALTDGAKQFVGEAQACGKYIGASLSQSASRVFGCLKTVFVKAARATGGALVKNVAKSLFDDAVNALGSNLPKARGLFQKLVNLLPGGALRNAGNAALGALNAGSSRFVNEARACGDQIGTNFRQSASAVFGCLRTAFIGAAKATGQAVALNVARSLFNDAIGWLGRSVPQARTRLQKLVNLLPAGALRDAGGAALGALNDGSRAFVNQARACGNFIRGTDFKQSAVQVFGCLKTAFIGTAKATGQAIAVAGARSLFNSAVGALGRSAAQAKGLFQRLVNMLPAGMLRNTGNAALAALNTGSQAFVNQARACGNFIQGTDFKQSAMQVFGCLKTAFIGTAKATGAAVAKNAAQAVFNGVVGALQRGGAAARGALQNLANQMSRFYPPVRAMAASIIGSLQTASKAFPAAAAQCGARVSGFNRQSAVSLFSCLRGALRASAGQVVATAKGAIQTGVNQIKAGIKKVVGNVRQIARNFLDLFRSVSRGRAQGLRSAQMLARVAATSKARTLALRALAQFRRGFQGAFRILYSVRNRMRSTLQRLNPAMLGPIVAGLAKGVAGTVAAAVTGKAARDFNTAKTALAGLADAGGKYLNGAAQAVTGRMKNLVVAMQQRFSSMVRGAVTALSTLAQHVK